MSLRYSIIISVFVLFFGHIILPVISQAESRSNNRINSLANKYFRLQQKRLYRPNLSRCANTAWVRTLQKYETKLKRINPSKLNQQARITHRMLTDEIRAQQTHVTAGWIKEDLNSVDSLMQTVVRGISDKKRRTIRDWKWTIKNLSNSTTFVRSYIELLRQGIHEGRILPALVVRSSIESLSVLTSSNRRENPFLELERELSRSFVGHPQGVSLRRELREVIYKEVLPAHRELKRFLETEYLSRASKKIGENRSRYLYHMAIHLGPDHPSPEVLSRWGQREVRKLLTQLQRVAKQIDPQAKNLPQFMDRLNRSKSSRYTSGAELLASAQEEILVAEKIAKRMAPIPSSQIKVTSVPPHEESTTAAQYLYTDKRTAEMQVNTGPLLKGQRRYELATLVTHEVYGGHHLANMAMQQQTKLPKFRKEALSTAFDEGWALYAEQWRYDHDGFTPHQKVGFLVDHLWRAARLVVDTGLHTGTMTPKQAVEYFQKNTFSSRADAEAEVERYINWPGQALAYYYGKQQILRTKREVKRILGHQFDERAFHSKLLKIGAVPLDEMHRVMISWAHRRAAHLK